MERPGRGDRPGRPGSSPGHPRAGVRGRSLRRDGARRLHRHQGGQPGPGGGRPGRAPPPPPARGDGRGQLEGRRRSRPGAAPCRHARHLPRRDPLLRGLQARAGGVPAHMGHQPRPGRLHALLLHAGRGGAGRPDQRGRRCLRRRQPDARLRHPHRGRARPGGGGQHRHEPARDPGLPRDAVQRARGPRAARRVRAAHAGGRRRGRAADAPHGAQRRGADLPERDGPGQGHHRHRLPRCLGLHRVGRHGDHRPARGSGRDARGDLMGDRPGEPRGGAPHGPGGQGPRAAPLRAGPVGRTGCWRSRTSPRRAEPPRRGPASISRRPPSCGSRGSPSCRRGRARRRASPSTGRCTRRTR